MSRQQITSLDITNGTVASVDLATNLSLAGTVTTDPWILNKPQSTISQMWSGTGNLGLINAAAGGLHFGSNVYMDATGAWMRMDIAQPASLMVVYPNRIVAYWVGAGANPIAWTKADMRLWNQDTDTAWTSATLLNAFTHYSAPFGPAGYRKMPDGTVVVRGLVSGGAASSTPVFTLPVGYRPATGRQYLFMVHNANGPIRIDVNDGGSVICGPMAIVGATYSTGWTSLDGIRFLAET
jgi:hypothetical protein